MICQSVANAVSTFNIRRINSLQNISKTNKIRHSVLIINMGNLFCRILNHRKIHCALFNIILLWYFMLFRTSIYSTVCCGDVRPIWFCNYRLLYDSYSYKLYKLYHNSIFLGKNTVWVFGKTPRWTIVTTERSLFHSSSFLLAMCKCVGIIQVFYLSWFAFPENSKASAAKYYITAARYRGTPAPILSD